VGRAPAASVTPTGILSLTREKRATAAQKALPAAGTTACATIACATARTTITVPRRARLGGVDRQRPAIDLLPIQGGDGCVGGFFRRHLDKGKAARPSSGAIGDHVHRGDLAMRCEQRDQPFSSCFVTHIAYVYVLAHYKLFSSTGLQPLGPFSTENSSRCPSPWGDPKRTVKRHSSPAGETRKGHLTIRRRADRR
jgi:hypothetical protein